MYFRYYRLSKTWLGHSLKYTVSEHPLTVNTLKGPKHLWNLHESTFIIFFISLMGNDFENMSLNDIWILEVFVNTSTAMTSILFINAKIFCSLLKRKYLKNNSHFFVPFLKYSENVKHFQKKEDRHS